MRSVFSEEKKLSIAALSQTFPDRLIVGHQALELLARILPAPVGVMPQLVRLAATLDRHHQSIRDELRRHLGLHDRVTLLFLEGLIFQSGSPHGGRPGGGTWTPREITQILAEGRPFRAHSFEFACARADIDRRLTEPEDPWING